MRAFFAKDSVLKILSFIISIIIWIYIIVVVDPSVDITIRDIPIQYIDQTKLAEQGLSVVGESKPTLELKIKGSRKKLAKLDSKNVIATVDLSTVTKAGTHSLPINVIIPYEYNEIVSKKPYTVDVTVDKIVEVRKDIKVVTKNSLENGFISGEIKVTPSSVSLKGAASIINKVSDVIVNLDLKNAKDDIYDTQRIILIDPDGNPISEDSDTYRLLIKDVNTADIYCPVMQLKTVPVLPKYIGKLPSSLDSTNVKFTAMPETVTICAEPSIVKGITQIETESINLNSINGSTDITAELKIPDNIVMRDDIKSITIRVQAE